MTAPIGSITPTPAGQTDQRKRKRKRQSDPLSTLVHHSLYRADGIVHLKSYRELPQMKISTEHSVLDLAEIPVLRSSHRVPNLAQRNLISQIRSQYLRGVLSLEEFKSVFIQVVRCRPFISLQTTIGLVVPSFIGHRVVYAKTGSLHGNLGPNKFMFTRDDDGAPLGCLDDLDSAKPGFGDEKSTTPAADTRAGDILFVTIELFREEPPPNRYRHDLESFMYILIWCALHFNLDGSEVLAISDPVAVWTHGTRQSIQDAKLSLFSSEVRLRNRIMGSITPAFLPVRRWVKGLIRLFHAGHKARMTRNDSLDSEAEEEAPHDWNEDTLNGTVIYENLTAAIGEKPHIAELGAANR